MARYAKQSDLMILNSTLIGLTNEDNTSASTVDEKKVIKALDQAQSEADSYIGLRYNLPLEIEIPLFLKQIVARLAIYFLYLYKGQKIPEDIKEDYDRAIEALREIGTGKRVLGATATDTEDLTEISAPIGRT